MIWYLFWDTLGLRYIMFFKSKTEEVKTLGKLAISGCQLSKKVVSSSPSSMSTVHVQKCWMIGTPLNNCVQQSKKRRKLLATHNYSGKFARDLPSSSSSSCFCYSCSMLAGNIFCYYVYYADVQYTLVLIPNGLTILAVQYFVTRVTRLKGFSP